jgi:hypothetical protein
MACTPAIGYKKQDYRSTRDFESTIYDAFLANNINNEIGFHIEQKWH